MTAQIEETRTYRGRCSDCGWTGASINSMSTAFEDAQEHEDKGCTGRREPGTALDEKIGAAVQAMDGIHFIEHSPGVGEHAELSRPARRYFARLVLNAAQKPEPRRDERGHA